MSVASGSTSQSRRKDLPAFQPRVSIEEQIQETKKIYQQFCDSAQFNEDNIFGYPDDVVEFHQQYRDKIIKVLQTFLLIP